MKSIVFSSVMLLGVIAMPMSLQANDGLQERATELSIEHSFPDANFAKYVGDTFDLDVSMLPNLQNFNVHGNSLLYLDISKNPKLINSLTGGTQSGAILGVDEKGSVDVSSIHPLFDISKVSNLVGGTISGNSITGLTIGGAGSYNYQLSATTTMVCNFTLTGKNNWTLAVDIDDWMYREVASVPVGDTSFGTVVYEYASANEPLRALVWDAAVPSEAGDYFVRGTMAARANYNALVSEPVAFTIFAKPHTNVDIPLIDKDSDLGDLIIDDNGAMLVEGVDYDIG